MEFVYNPKGVCARQMVIDVENGIVNDVKIIGGCHGNSQGISSLVKGMKAQDVIERLSDIKCGFKSTSCPAQLANALKEHLEK